MTQLQATARDPRTAGLVTALVQSGVVVPERAGEVAAVVDRVLGDQGAAASPVRRRLAELAGYIGGAFVLAAAGIFLGTQWASLATAGRVGLLAGIAVALVVAGGLVGPGHLEPVRRRLAGVLFTGAAACAAGAVGVLSDHLGAGETPTLLGVFGTLAVLSLLGYLVCPTVVGQLGVAAGLSAAVPLLLDLAGVRSSALVGLGLFLAGVVWLLAAERGVWREVACARVLGCALALSGAQLAVFVDDDQRWAGYLLLALVAAAAFVAYVARPAWPYLALGVVAVTLVVPEALLDWTDNALGPAGGMLVTGLALLGASLVGFRLRRGATRDV
jgi:hypothetical protein